MEKATRIFRNGLILTMDSRASEVQALATKGDRILAVGSDAEIMRLKGADTNVTDLGGQTMLPGFVDGHSHFLQTGMMYLAQVDLSPPPMGAVTTIDELVGMIRKKASETPLGECVVGFGYDDTLLAENRHPLAEDLDKATTGHPVIVRHISGHLCSCNSKALQMSGITRDTVAAPGGVIRRDGSGNPTGVLEEPPAMGLVAGLLPEAGIDDWMKAVECATRAYVAKGFTSAQDGYTDETGWKILREAYERPDSPLRIRVQMLPGVTRMDLSQIAEKKSGTQLTPDCMISVGAAKHLADGSLQCYTGYLSNPYHKVIYKLPGGPMWRGYPINQALELNKMVMELHCKGWQIALHGNGDDAIQQILDAIEDAQCRYPRADARHIIIHCQTVREDQLERIKRLGIIPSFFVVHTYYWGDRHYSTFLGPDRAERISPLRSALNRGIPFSTHNDTFVTPIDALLSVWSAVNRKTIGGKILGEAQTIPVMESLRSVTSWAAYQSCEEDIKGSLEPGKLADMVVLAENPLTVPKETIKDIKITATVLGGREVFGTL